jgi:hypothetical protein
LTNSFTWNKRAVLSVLDDVPRDGEVEQPCRDSVVPALAVRVSPKGRKTFVMVARFNGAKHPTRRKLGAVGHMTVEQA